MATPKKLPGPAVSMIKTEPGTTSRNPSLRLPSFRAPRDMMLGGTGANHGNQSAARKTYVPNLNLQRKKNQEDVVVKVERSADVVRGRGRGARGRGRGGERGRGRGSDLVQSETGSLFSQGVAADVKPKRSAAYSDRESTGSASEYKSKIKASVKVLDEKENRERLSALLQDDFVDDPGISPNTANMPTQLPTLKIKTELLPKKELRAGVQIKTEDTNGEVKVKQEVCDAPLPVRPVFDHQEVFTMTQLFKTVEPQLLLLKLPDFMPQFEAEDDNSRPSTSKPTAEPTDADETKAAPERLTLPEGRVGKLQRLKSGRVRLVLGDQVLYTELGVHTALKQDLVSVSVDPNAPGGDMMNFGKINARIISSPLYNPQPA